MMKFRNEIGQTLIELMTSIVIITVALAGVVAIFPYIIQQNAKIQMQNEATFLAQSEIERFKSLKYSDSDLDAIGTSDGVVKMKSNDKFLIRTTVKYIDPNTGVPPEKYPLELKEDTGLKEITVSVKRKDNRGIQVNLITFVSKSK